MAQTFPQFAAIMRQINGEELSDYYAGIFNTYNPGAFDMPEANPKAARAVSDGKAPLDYLEPVCDAGEARVLKGGADKYGRRNFRDPSTVMLWSTYLGSMRRHLNALHAGEDTDPDSGEHHLSHIRANTAVLLAAMDAGTLRDDRHDTAVTPRSDAVHKDGNQDAKADVFYEAGPDLTAPVEPFVVTGRDGQPLSDKPCCVDMIDGVCIGPRDPDCCRMEAK